MRNILTASASTTCLVVAVACSSSGGGAASSAAKCALQPADSVFARHAPVYRECAVTTKARLIANNLQPDFTPPPGRSNGCFSAEFDFVVTPTGNVDANTARLLRTNNEQLAEATRTMLARVRYEPATRDGVPVAQIVNMKQELIAKTIVVPAGQKPNPGRAGPGC